MNELPKGWSWVSIGETGEYINGFAFKPNHRESRGLPIVRIQNLTDESKALNTTQLDVPVDYKIDNGTMLVSWSATLDVFLWQRGPALVNQHIFKVVPEEKVVSKKLLFHWLKRSIQQLQKTEHLHGSTMMHINRGPFMAHRVPLPPLSEQTRIVAKLEELLTDLDAGVAELKVAQKKLGQYRQSLLKAAVDGNLTAEWRKNNPPIETGAELLERILKERRTRWEAKQLAKFQEQGKTPPKDWQHKYAEPNPPAKVGLFDLPGNWSWSSVEQLAELVSGHTPKDAESCSNSGGDIGWFKVGDMNKPGNDVWLTNAEIKFDLQTALSLGMKPAPKGTIVFPKRGGAIATNKKRRLANMSCFDLNTMGLIPSPHVADWLWSYFQGIDLGQLSSGSNVPQINNPDIAPLCVPLPPIDEQLEIICLLTLQLESTFEQEKSIHKSLKQAAAQRQNILRAAFAGQLVPQDPNDEPASVLLERIRTERATQVKPKTRGRKKVAA